MKNVKIGGLVLLTATMTALSSLSVFAGPSGQLAFNQDQVKKDPTFHCDVTEDKGFGVGSLSTTRITFTSDAAINFGRSGKKLDVAIGDLKDNYFYVTKDQGGDGMITYTANNDSTVVCAQGNGGRPKQYNN